ncbi:CoA-dependent acyltransferase [Cubamyces sp. BRFM 1775]|nr:CoA-dependent acyltransferase [Cubamyces sp. BRFM 1775]
MLFRHPAAILLRSGRHLPRALFHASPAHYALKRFKLADIGEGITECEVVKWNVKPSTPVNTFDPLCEVQSDKASVEITSPFDGIIKELFVEEGQVAKVGQDLCTIEVADDAAAEESESAPTSAPPEQSGSSGAGYGTPPEPVQPSHPPTGSPTATQHHPAPARRPHPLDPNVPQDTRASLTSGNDVLATPSVRHYARQHNVDLSQLAPGSGKGGRIEKRDVDAFLQRGSTQTAAPQAATSFHPAAPETGKDVTIELNRTRWNMWKAMEKSLAIPQFTCSTTLDLTELHNMMPILNSHIPAHYLPQSARPSPASQVISPASFHAPPSPPEVPPSAHYTRLTYLPILLKTLARAMLEWPLFRSSIASTPSADAGAGGGNAKPTMTIRPHADISIALSTPTGLYTPTIQAADTQSVYALAAQLRHLAHLGRQVPCALTPSEMPRKGGTISVSNVGGIGAVESAAPVLVPGGGVAIVAIGRAKWVWDVERDSKGERRLKVGVSWSADHRVVEGAEMVAFMEAWRSWVEAPQRLIADSV